MSADEKAEAAVPSLDPRTAEVLRFLDRAKVTIAKTQTGPSIDATAESVESTPRVIEAVVAVAREISPTSSAAKTARLVSFACR